jgi:hypothetical protein
MGFNRRTGSHKEVLNVADLLAATVKHFDLPVLSMGFLKLGARKGAAFVLVRVEVDVVSHVVVFVDGLKYCHKVEILQVRVKPLLGNAAVATC